MMSRTSWKRGRLLIEAADELERGSYEATVKRHFDLSYARKLRIIAAHPVLSHRSHADRILVNPEAWRRRCNGAGVA